PQTTSRPMARIQALNNWIKGYAAAHEDIYLDYFSAMTDGSGLLRAELSEDDLHPNAKGYAIMAPLAEAAIARALKYGGGGDVPEGRPGRSVDQSQAPRPL